MPVIMYNGAMIYNYFTDKILYSQSLPELSRKMTSEILNIMPDTGGEVVRADGTYPRDVNFSMAFLSMPLICFLEFRSVPSISLKIIIFVISSNKSSTSHLFQFVYYRNKIVRKFT